MTLILIHNGNKSRYRININLLNPAHLTWDERSKIDLQSAPKMTLARMTESRSRLESVCSRFSGVIHRSHQRHQHTRPTLERTTEDIIPNGPTLIGVESVWSRFSV